MSANYNYDTYNLLYTMIGTGFFLVTMLISLVIFVLTLVAMWKIFVKAGKPGWACIVPFYSQYCLFDIAWGNGWLFLLCFIPCVNFVVMIMLYLKLARAFGKGTGFGLILLNTIFILILGLGDARYIGPQN